MSHSLLTCAANKSRNSECKLISVIFRIFFFSWVCNRNFLLQRVTPAACCFKHSKWIDKKSFQKKCSLSWETNFRSLSKSVFPQNLNELKNRSISQVNKSIKYRGSSKGKINKLLHKRRIWRTSCEQQNMWTMNKTAFTDCQSLTGLMGFLNSVFWLQNYPVKQDVCFSEQFSNCGLRWKKKISNLTFWALKLTNPL